MDRRAWRQVLRGCRIAWRTLRLETLETLERPALSAARRIGPLTLRSYMLFAIVIIAIKLIQVTR